MQVRHGRIATGFYLALACAAHSFAHAADRQGVAYALSIPGQPLDAALQEFSRQSGIEVVFLSQTAAGKQAPEVVGTYTLDDALVNLLSGSTLGYRLLGSNAVEITTPSRRQKHRGSRAASSNQPAPMPEIVIRGVAEGVVASRTETPLREIPQSVSVVSLAQIREQNLTDLTEALDRTSGVTTQRDLSTEKSYLVRGFPLRAFHVDGSANLQALSLQQSFSWFPRPDLSQFERIEVLRGADGLFSGNGPPGGSVNFVRKRPRADPAVSLIATSGSWNNYRLELDATGALAFDGALRGRVGGAFADGDFFYDTATQSRKKAFFSLEYDATPTTVLTLGGSYQRDDSIPVAMGLPWNNDGTDPRIPRKTALTFDWTYYRTQTLEGYLQLQQRFGDEWKLKFGAAQWRGRLEHGTAAPQPRADAVTGIIYYYPPSANFSTEPERVDQWATDLTLTGAFELFGTRVEMASGVEFAQLQYETKTESYNFLVNGPPVRLEDLDLSSFADPRLSRNPSSQSGSLSNYLGKGGFVALKVLLSDAWSVGVGARTGQDRSYGWVQQSSGRVHGETPWSERVVTPYAVVMYDFSENYSLYASYTDIFERPQPWSIGPDGKSTGTMHGVNIEAGVKASWRDGALYGALAVYKLVQHRAILTSRPAGVSGYLTGDSLSRGIDLELSGTPAPGWLFGGGYSFNENRKPTAVWQGVRGPLYNLSALSGITPKHLVKVWASKQLPGDLSRWSVGGNLHAQTSQKIEARECVTGGAPGSFCRQRAGRLELPGYVILDLRAGLQLDSNWRVGLSVNNVLDKRYFDSVSDTNTRYSDFWYGEPRNYLLKLEAAF